MQLSANTTIFFSKFYKILPEKTWNKKFLKIGSNFFFQYSLPKIETRFIRLLESFSRAASVISVPRKSSIGVVKTLKINEYLTFSGHIFTNFESKNPRFFSPKMPIFLLNQLQSVFLFLKSTVLATFLTSIEKFYLVLKGNKKKLLKK